MENSNEHITGSEQVDASSNSPHLSEQEPDPSLESSPASFLQKDEESDEVLLQMVQTVFAEVQSLREAFEAKLKYDADKTRLIDILHKELQDYREGLHFKILRPLLMELVSIYNDVDKLIDDMQTSPPEDIQQVILNFRSFQESIEESLSHNGVEAFQVDEETFVAGMQHIVKVITTQDPALDRKISRRRRKGFRYDNRVLRPELVDTYKFAEDVVVSN